MSDSNVIKNECDDNKYFTPNAKGYEYDILKADLGLRYIFVL